MSEVVFLLDGDNILLDNDRLVSHFPAVAPVRAAAPDPEYPEEYV